MAVGVVDKNIRKVHKRYVRERKRYARTVRKNVADAKKRYRAYKKRLIRKDLKKVIIIGILIVLVAVLFFVLMRNFSPESAADWLKQFGPYGPVVVVLLIALEVVVTPIPGVLINIASGYAFGPYLGTLYSYIGSIIGINIAFFLSRRFGRPLVEKLTTRKKLVEFDRFSMTKGKIFLWVAFLIPVFPSDLLCYAIGLSNMRWRTFIVIAGIALIPATFFLNQVGGSLRHIGVVSLALGGLLALTYLLGFLWYMRIRKHRI